MKDYTSYDNLILKSDELTTLKLVKLQAEPLLTLLRCLEDVNCKVSDALTDLSTKFSQVDVEEFAQLPKYLITFFFMVGSIDHNELRKHYLEKIKAVKEYASLSQEMSKTINELVIKNKKLPWNSKIMPRFRPYKENRLSSIDENRVTLALILEMTIEDIVLKDTVRRNEIDVISYSKAVHKKVLSDTIENTLVSDLYKLLLQFKPFAASFLRNSAANTGDDKIVYLLSYLWFNRILQAAMEKLYVNNSVNSMLIDQLNLHFKWFSKHCVNLLATDTSDGFMKTFQGVQNFTLSHQHPMKLYKKIYVKTFTSFLPFYDEDQVNRFQQLMTLNDIVRIVPKTERLYDFERI
jgi:hypothetical protein